MRANDLVGRLLVDRGALTSRFLLREQRRFCDAIHDVDDSQGI